MMFFFLHKELILMKHAVYHACYPMFFFVKVHLPRRNQPQQERHNLVTRLSASLLTPWLFPDKCCCPLDSTSLRSRVMANYQEAVCWKDAARNYICLQTAIKSKHMHWNKLPSNKEAHSQTRVVFRALCVFRNVWAADDMGEVIYLFSFLLCSCYLLDWDE